MQFEEGQEVMIDYVPGMMKATIKTVRDDACRVFVHRIGKEMLFDINHIYPVEPDFENMIESKLGELIHNRRTNIKEVHEATGLSRTTISNLVNGYASGIRFETLTKLSNHFNCEITDIINYEKEEEV